MAAFFLKRTERTCLLASIQPRKSPPKFQVSFSPRQLSFVYTCIPPKLARGHFPSAVASLASWPRGQHHGRGSGQPELPILAGYCSCQFSAKFRQNFARFRLYRRRSLQANTRFAAFFKIYQIIQFKFLKFGKFPAKFRSFSAISAPIFASKYAFCVLQHFSKSTRLSSWNFWNSAKFPRLKFLQNLQISAEISRKLLIF